MTRDEAMALWAKADRAGEDAYVEAIQAGAVTADDAHKTGSLAAATVIQQAFAERDGGIERLREALVQHNERLRSAQAIAQRDGADTNWLAFRGQCTFTLAEYHDLVNEARQALAAKGDSRG